MYWIIISNHFLFQHLVYCSGDRIWTFEINKIFTLKQMIHYLGMVKLRPFFQTVCVCNDPNQSNALWRALRII